MRSEIEVLKERIEKLEFRLRSDAVAFSNLIELRLLPSEKYDDETRKIIDAIFEVVKK